MLIYSPAFDLSHCIFRIFFIINSFSENTSIEIDKIRIIDFYLSYPGCVNDFKFPEDMRDIKNEFKEISKEYRDPINHKITFQRISILQKKAISSLLSLGYIDIDSYKKGEVKRTSKKFSSDIKDKLSNFSFYGNYNLPLILVITFLNIELKGEKGLKARSGLMEYRYEHS
ncbi:ABC-three component system middle component 5 [Acinetobacter indicus]|uniref:ABC-three component system middle component 5 n=1 Tax=Acinetobacter indicus TaxID=756892 RepID=UPI000948D0AA|nr:ABC-three component system middle component 5 [Acinetobacter indicus]